MRGTVKVCSDCGLPFAPSKFTNRYSKCTKCKNICYRYKISGKVFHKMLLEQMSCCLICEAPINEKKAVIDHDHDTGVVRGLLCSNCNTGIGLFKHDKEIAYRAVEYLTKHK